MTTAPDTLPLRPAGGPAQGANAQYAPPRTRTREGKPRAEAVTGLLRGASPLHGAPPSIMEVWGRHKVSAGFYDGILFRWPRYAYGFWHSFIETPLAYVFVWTGDSLPKRLISITVVLAVLRLLGIHMIWSWL